MKWQQVSGTAQHSAPRLPSCGNISKARNSSPSKTSWWDTLAGSPFGKPSVREGIKFPVLRVAQIRQGMPVTPNAICRNENEVPPDVIATKRWPKKQLPVKAKRLTQKASRSRQARAS